MMHGAEKSGLVIVAGKPANKAEQPAPEGSAAMLNAAEPVERRAGTKGNADQQSTRRTQSWVSVSQALERIRQVARERRKERFTALFHHIGIELLAEAFCELKADAAPGVDQLTWKDYEADLGRNLEDLHDRVQRGAYRALPSRRVYIPKPDGRQRPLAVAALEDKIVQRAVVTLLNAIYEEDFLGFSCGFRPGRGTHDALDALCVGICRKKVSFILDADIRSFFDEISHDWLIRFLEHRIGDRRIIRLIQKWLKAGVLEDGVVMVSDRGTGQGSVISPLLANVYLHYALDLWTERWRRREATGDMIIVRYADDFIIGFQHEEDARRFLDEMRERLREFALSLHPEKTRLIEFGRFAAERRLRRGLGKPETFDFLGFTFICGKTRSGKFQLRRKSRRDRMKAKLRMIKEELRQRMHQSIPVQGRWLRRVVGGYFNYHAVPTNARALDAFRHHVTDLWRRTLRRRSQKDRMTWERMIALDLLLEAHCLGLGDIIVLPIRTVECRQVACDQRRHARRPTPVGIDRRQHLLFRSNFRYHCATLARIHNEILLMPMTYNTLIGDMGSSLSGGQKQRVLLARALYRQPRILFLDEGTAHLDVENERHINESLRDLSMTRISVAHRPGMSSGADRIVRIDQGLSIQLGSRPAD